MYLRNTKFLLKSQPGAIFYLKDEEIEKISTFIASIRQFAGALKSMSVNFEDCEMTVAFLNWLPDPVDGPISALKSAYVFVEKLHSKLSRFGTTREINVMPNTIRKLPRLPKKSPLAGSRGPKDHS